MVDDKSKDKAKAKRTHKASYATDKKKGGYLIRVVGPYAERFAGRTLSIVNREVTTGISI